MASSGFWIMFDTAARPDRPAYYRDVHDVIAYPTGGIVRYTYRTDYHAAEAQHMAERAVDNPRLGRDPVLVVYCQRRGYERQQPSPGADTLASELVWVATRFGDMVDIRRSGKSFEFDFVVKGYPSQNEIALQAILSPLIARSETPFHKWVAYSKTMEEFSKLRISGLRVDAANSNWHAIVNLLGSSPCQFRSDLFWRVVRLSEVGATEVTPRAYEAASAGGLPTPRVSYDVLEGKQYAIELARHTPPSGTVGGASVSSPETVSVELPDSSPLMLVSPNQVTLRPTGNERIIVRAQRVEEIDPRYTIIRLATPMRNDWPAGPDVVLGFTVRKKALHLLIGTGLVVLAAGLGIAGGFLIRATEPWKVWTGIGAFVIAALCGAIGGLILTRRIPLRLS